MSISNLQICNFFEAPQTLTIDHVNSTGFVASIIAPKGNKDIQGFEITIDGGCVERTCKLENFASPLVCPFFGLLAATKYIVNARTCLPNSIGCSENVTVVAITMPRGTRNYKKTH